MDQLKKIISDNFKQYKSIFYSKNEDYYLKFLLFLTNRCNLNCHYCSMKQHRQQNNKDINLQIVKDFIQSTQKLDHCEVSFFGGEPLLHKNFSEIFSLFDPVKYSLTVLTNGTISFVNKFTHKKFDVQITYHSSQMNDKLDKLFIKNLSYLKDNGYKFGVSFTFQDKKSFEMYNFLKNDFKENLYQIYIDGKYNNKILNNYDSEGFYLNNKFIALEKILKYKLNNFKNWYCYDNMIDVYEDGSFLQNCGPLKGNISNYVFTKVGFIKCNRLKCESMCNLCKLKIRI